MGTAYTQLVLLMSSCDSKKAARMGQRAHQKL